MMSFNEARDLLWIASILYLFAVGFGFASTYFSKNNFCKQATLLAIIIGFFSKLVVFTSVDWKLADAPLVITLREYSSLPGH